MLLLDRISRNAAFLIGNPAVIKRAVRNYFAKTMLNKKPLRTADICFDYVCNLNCKHCYTTEFVDKSRRPLGLQDIRCAVDSCLKEGAIHFNLIGGEPTLDKHLFDVMDYIHARGAIISLATNGSLLTADYVKQLKRHKLDLVLVSMDSFDQKKQDEFRGEGYFERVIAAIENCLNERVKVYVSAVVTKDTMEDKGFQDLLKYCQAKDILLHSNLPALFGNWKDRDDLFLTPESQKSIRQLYKNKHIRSCEMSSYFSCACTSGLEKLHITAYGDVLPCAFIPVSFGNILQDDLSSIRKRILEFPFFKQHNEMCIPSTNRQYHQFYKAHINPVKILPVQYDAIKDFL